LKKLEQAVLLQIAEAKLKEAELWPEPTKKTMRQAKDQVLTVRSLVHKQPDVNCAMP
jgi:hypothetical protein